MGDQRSSKKMMNLGSIAGSDAGSSITGGKLDDGKRKSRNLSEKKRRDQFNLLISALHELVQFQGSLSSATSKKAESKSDAAKKMDKSSVLRSAIQFLKLHAESLKEQGGDGKRAGDKGDGGGGTTNIGQTTDSAKVIPPPGTAEAKQMEADSQEANSWKPSFLSNDEFAHLMLEALDAFVIILEADGSGRVIYASDSVTPLLGYNLNEMCLRRMKIRTMPRKQDISMDHSTTDLGENEEIELDNSTTRLRKDSESHCGFSDEATSYSSITIYDLIHESEKQTIKKLLTGHTKDPNLDPFISLLLHFKQFYNPACGNKPTTYELVRMMGTFFTIKGELIGSGIDNAKCFVAVGRLQAPKLLRDLKMIIQTGIEPLTSSVKTNEFVSRHSLEWKFLFLDHRAPPLIGYLPFELLGTSGYDYYHWEDLDRIIAGHMQLMQTGEGTSCPYRFSTRGQQWIWLQTRYFITYHQWNSKPEFIVCTHQVICSNEDSDEDDIDQLLMSSNQSSNSTNEVQFELPTPGPATTESVRTTTDCPSPALPSSSNIKSKSLKSSSSSSYSSSSGSDASSRAKSSVKSSSQEHESPHSSLGAGVGGSDAPMPSGTQGQGSAGQIPTTRVPISPLMTPSQSTVTPSLTQNLVSAPTVYLNNCGADLFTIATVLPSTITQSPTPSQSQKHHYNRGSSTRPIPIRPKGTPTAASTTTSTSTAVPLMSTVIGNFPSSSQIADTTNKSSAIASPQQQPQNASQIQAPSQQLVQPAPLTGVLTFSPETINQTLLTQQHLQQIRLACNQNQLHEFLRRRHEMLQQQIQQQQEELRRVSEQLMLVQFFAQNNGGAMPGSNELGSTDGSASASANAGQASGMVSSITVNETTDGGAGVESGATCGLSPAANQTLEQFIDQNIIEPQTVTAPALTIPTLSTTRATIQHPDQGVGPTPLTGTGLLNPMDAIGATAAYSISQQQAQIVFSTPQYQQ